MLLNGYRIPLRQWRLILATLIFTILPDFDLLLGYVAGNPNQYHHQATHTLIFVVGAGLLGGWLWGMIRREERKQALWLFVLAGMAHLLLDTLSVDSFEPYGVPLFWPFWSEYLRSPIPIFSDVYRSSDARDFFASLFNRHNLYTVLLEVVILLPVTLMVGWLRRKKYAKS